MTGLALGMLEQELQTQLQRRRSSQEEEDRLQVLVDKQKENRQLIEDRITDLTKALKKLRELFPE